LSLGLFLVHACVASRSAWPELLSSMAAKRHHFSGDGAALAAALLPFAEQKGVSFVRYDCEARVTSKSKVLHGERGVESHHGVLHALYKLQPNLSFPRAVVESALQKVLEACGAKWRLSASEGPDWVQTISRRLRNMCRAVAQGQLKRGDSAWVRALPWNSTPLPQPMLSEARSSSSLAPPGANEALFDQELLLPFRHNADGTRELGLPIDLDQRKASATANRLWVYACC